MTSVELIMSIIKSSPHSNNMALHPFNERAIEYTALCSSDHPNPARKSYFIMYFEEDDKDCSYLYFGIDHYGNLDHDKFDKLMTKTLNPRPRNFDFYQTNIHLSDPNSIEMTIDIFNKLMGFIKDPDSYVRFPS